MTDHLIKVPDGSIYFWMYNQGLKHVPIKDIKLACSKIDKPIRPKDFQNYWNGYYKYNLYQGSHVMSLLDAPLEQTIKPFYSMNYYDYPVHPYLDMPEIMNRFVPCTAKGTPIIKWSKGCMTSEDAMAMVQCQTLAENLKGTRFIVIDIDGDHGNELHKKTYEAFHDLAQQTHCLNKPGFNVPTSYHLTFSVNRVIPTYHFTKAHIDIIGNRANSIRYFKNKIWNNKDPMIMTDSLWNNIQSRIKELEELNE